MTFESSNSTENFFDLSINKSIDFIATAFYQLLQLIFCLVIIVLVGKFVSLASKTASTDHKSEESKVETESKEEIEELVEEKLSGWESEQISKDPFSPPIEIPSSKAQAKVIKKQLKRKCMSVGPIMLTPPNSQIIRTLNVEDREERYRYELHYDILPPDTSKDENELAENVCVPCVLF